MVYLFVASLSEPGQLHYGTLVAANLGRGVGADAVALDNCCVGWSGRATIDWPEDGTRLAMTAEPPLDCLVVFTPTGRPFFCVEPVSHVTDAFNLAAAGGLTPLSEASGPASCHRLPDAVPADLPRWDPTWERRFPEMFTPPRGLTLAPGGAILAPL